MSTLDFIPRALKQKKPHVEEHRSVPPRSNPEITTSVPSQGDGAPKAQKKKQQQDTKPSWDFAFLVWLALSDYWLWVDGDLRRRMENNAARPGVDVQEENLAENPIVDEEDAMDVDDKESNLSHEHGFVPLNHLLKQSTVFRLVSNLQPYRDAKEITYVNSLRQFANEVIDVRFIVDPESSSTRAAVFNISKRRRKPQSGYEVRRMDFGSLKNSESSQYGKSRWDALTIYMENIPIQYAKLPGIGKLITTLLPASSSPPMKRVQNIIFPPHHQDLPDAVPICKGFALVTLSSENDVQALLDAWPWDSEKDGDAQDSIQPNRDDVDKKPDNENTDEARSAKSSRLRICTKARWEELRAEYLLYRQQLIDEINQHQDEEESRWQKASTDEGQQSEGRSEEDKVASGSKRKQVESTAQLEVGIHPGSPYPTACLVFVRHVHPETNKTTLRTLFSQAWKENNNNAIDYIDYTKNMDSCYVRFGTPAQAEFFIDYFSSHPITQSSGLDANGSEPSEGVKVILPEIVLGKREELYWEKVPQKLRKQAVEKTLRAVHGPDFVEGSGAVGEEAPREGDDGRKKRRRKANAAQEEGHGSSSVAPGPSINTNATRMPY